MPKRPPKSPRRRANGEGGHFERQLRGTDEPRPDRCAARLARTKPPRYCSQPKGKRTDHPGFGPCWLHGGRAPRGEASATYKHGEYSADVGIYRKMLRGHFLEAYVETLGQANLRTLREQIALAAGLEHEAVGRVMAPTGESRAGWVRLGELTKQLDAALRDKDAARLNIVWPEMRDIATGMAAAHSARAELQEVLELQRRLRDTEGRLVERERLMVPVEQAILWARAFADLALRYIKDDEHRRQFARDIRAVGAGATPAAPPAAEQVP